jgi:uncharacterized protein
MRLHIPFSEIPEHGLRIAISDRSWLSDDLGEKAESASAEVQLTKKSEERIEIQGALQVEFRLICDRCLAEYVFPLVTSLQLIVESPDGDRHWRIQDMEGGGDELDTLQVSEPVIDLADILCQQVYLALPAKQLCGKNCLGLCIHCGHNLNDGPCGCHEDQAANSPFAVLAGYREHKKKK